MTAQQTSLFESESAPAIPEDAIEIVSAVSAFPERISAIEKHVEEFAAGVPESIEPGTEEEVLAANEALKTIKRLFDEAEDTRKELTRPLREKVESVNDSFRPLSERLKQLETAFKNGLIRYKQKEAARIAEEQRKAAELARIESEKKAAEAAKLAAKSEDKQTAAEALRAAAEQCENEREAKALLRKAERLDRDGATAALQAQTAEAVSVAIQAAPVVVASKAVKTSGSALKKSFEASIIDKEAFLRWAIETGNLHFVEINISMLTGIAKQTKGAQQWPGVLVSETAGLSTRYR